MLLYSTSSLLSMLSLILLLLMSDLTASDVCTYKDSKADCSKRNLTYIPRLRNHTTSLNFSDNRLGNITRESFTNLTTLQLNQLILTNNSIFNIAHDAFADLLYLGELVLDVNPVPARVLQSAFGSLNKSGFTRLGLSNMSLQTLDARLFDGLEDSGVKYIALQMNNLRSVNLSVFRPLSKLSHLDLSFNFIYNLRLDPALRVSTLNLKGNILSVFPSSNCVMPHVRVLYLQNNDVLYVRQRLFRCFPNVATINLSENPVRKIYSYAFSSLHRLGILRMDNLCGLKTIQRNAFSNPRLKRITLLNNNLKFSEPTISHFMFNGSRNLNKLDLSGNNMLKTTKMYLTRLFQPVNATLQFVKLANCILHEFPFNLSSFHRLTHLDLTGNALTVLRKDYFSHSLRWISLKDNDISLISENSLPANLTNLSIDLARNPFDCTCELLWFLRLIQETKSEHIFNQSEKFRCNSPRELAGKNFTFLAEVLSDQSCLLGKTTTLIIIVSVTSMLFLTLAAAAVYHVRWHFRYLLYMLRFGKETDDTEEYRFDAFVAYADEDLKWILEQAIPNLEEREHFHLCIHQRDFELGALEIDNLVFSVNESKKFIILISNHFAKSQWCKFCLALIQRQIRSQCLDIMMVVKLGDIEQRHMSPSLFDLLTTVEYIDWSTDSRAVGPFWERLVHFIKTKPRQLKSVNSAGFYVRSFSDGQQSEDSTNRRLMSEPCLSGANSRVVEFRNH